jgi:hypothetical protein
MMFYRTNDGIYESYNGVIDPKNRREACDRLKLELPADSELSHFLNEVLQESQEQKDQPASNALEMLDSSY